VSFIQSLARPAFSFFYFFSKRVAETEIHRSFGSVGDVCHYQVDLVTQWPGDHEPIFFFSFPYLGLRGVCKGFVFVFLLLLRSLRVSVLFCLVLVGLCSITSARAKSRAQALVIRSHNSVVVDIRRITCISLFAPDSHRFAFFTCFLSLKRRAIKFFRKFWTLSCFEVIFTSSVSTN